MKALALDVATHCGWATLSDGIIVSGTWDLSIRRDESGGMRLMRFHGKLKEIRDALKGIDIIVYEAARHGAPKMQGALVVQAELQGVLKLWAESINVPYRGYSPSEIKKFATGKGNANKEAMLKAAREKLNLPTVDDNEADARWLLELARRDLKLNEKTHA